MNSTNIWHSPAKLNLYLAIVGIRESDGFHDLDSLVVQLDFGDTLQIGLSPAEQDIFSCTDNRLSWSSDNLIKKAVDLYRLRTGFNQPVKISLQKEIPLGAGLGGGSSNAATILKALNSLNPKPVTENLLKEWSADLGSDCPLFFAKGITRIQGRGEIVSALKTAFENTLKQRKILLFHPGFGITAAWAYRQLKTGYPRGYSSRDLAEEEVNHWMNNSEPWLSKHRNDLQSVVDHKYLSIPLLKEELTKKFGIFTMMSGSGSSCFCILDESIDTGIIEQHIRFCWGTDAFIRNCRFQG